MSRALDERWGTAALQAALQQVLDAGDARDCLQADVQAVAQTDSTNTQLLDAARSDTTPCLRLLVAEAQSAGRGRLGRAWHAAPGASLTFSMSMPMAAVHAQALSLRVGLCTAMTLDPYHSSAAPLLLVKWPNDVWLRDAHTPWGGRKLGGILIETTAAAHGRVLVVGIGLNLTSPGPDTVDARHGVASLAELAAAHRALGHEGAEAAASNSSHGGNAWATAARTLHRLAPAVLHALRQGDAAWLDAWPGRDALLGRRVAAGAANAPSAIEGIASGVSDDGTLLLRSDDGRVHPISSGEISITVMR